MIRQRLFAWALARFNKKYEQFAAQYKRKLFADVCGVVLEIGPGTGANLSYFARPGVRWIGVEPNRFMEPYLEEEAKRLGIQIDLRTGQAHELPVDDNSVDAVVGTLVLCCVRDPQRAIKEIIRVLKPGGRFVFIEHVAAPRGTWLRLLQGCVKPVWSQMGDGCHPDRETWNTLEKAGFARLEYERITAPSLIVSPQIVGAAVKAFTTIICAQPG
jgi:ubiquinone/menaquinone biosynthesis C-methylase UbiE